MISIKEEPVDCYSIGLCHISCCALKTMTKDDIEHEVNRMHPTGIPSKWEITEKKFNSGESNPCPCNEDEDCQHWVLTC